jgi:hypothetical protein
MFARRDGEGKELLRGGTDRNVNKFGEEFLSVVNRIHRRGSVGASVYKFVSSVRANDFEIVLYWR